MPRRVTDARRNADSDSEEEDWEWRTSPTQRTPKRRAVSTASFYETSDGRNLGAEYKKIDEARKRQAAPPPPPAAPKPPGKLTQAGFREHCRPGGDPRAAVRAWFDANASDSSDDDDAPKAPPRPPSMDAVSSLTEPSAWGKQISEEKAGVPASPLTGPSPPLDPKTLLQKRPSTHRSPEKRGDKRSRAPWAAAASPPTRALKFTGVVEYAATLSDAADACAKIQRCCRTQKGRWPRVDAVLGFDVEWKVTYEAGCPPRKVATVQLAAHDYACVVHVSKLGKVPPRLACLLASPTILKVGVGARNDARKLSTDYALEKKVAPVVDLRDLADAVHLPGNRGLADLVATALKCLLPKPARTRTGDWEAYPLTAEQRDYAALDAYASFRVFSMLAARASPTALGDVTNRAADSVPPVMPAGETPPESQPELECKPRRSAVAWRDPVAARPQVGHVQPAKQAAYDDYFLFGKTAEAIAADKSIKVGTVYNYLSEAVDRGLAYDWARFEEDLGGPHVFAAIKAALAAGRSRSDVRKVLDVEWWQISLVQAHTTRLALRDADAMAAQAAGADHAAAVQEPVANAASFSEFAYASQNADVAQFALFFE